MICWQQSERCSTGSTFIDVIYSYNYVRLVRNAQ